MPQDVGKRDSARPSLSRIHPVPAPWIRNNVSIPAIPDVKPVQRMKRNRQPDAEQLKKEYERKIRQKRDLPRIGRWPVLPDGGRVGNENVFEKKRTDRDDPRQGM